ncbi:MAG: ankyrin repeat domain-containing protein [Bdellovibrionales bacterium]|nr:ankyrin repeat domain-containing protein [Bdellovibrionales bacterium]
MKLMQSFIATVLMFSITACSSSNSGSPAVPTPAPGPVLPDFNKPISSQTCVDPMFDAFGEPDFFEKEVAKNLGHGDAPCLKKAIELGKVDVNKKLPDVFGHDPKLPIFRALEDSPLFFAKAAGTTFDVLKVLFESGARLSVLNDDGETPLLFAMKHVDQNSYPEAAQYLVQTGDAEPDKRDREGNAAIHYAVKLKNTVTLDLLEAQSIQLNIQDREGNYPLIMAINNDWELGARSLVEAGASLDAKDIQSKTALHRAIEKTFNSLSTFLISKMSKDQLNTKDAFDSTALSLAVDMQNAEVAPALIDAGVDVNIKDHHGRLPLHYAMSWNFEEVAKKLISLTSNLNASDARGESPIHVASRNKNLNYLTWLLDAGALIDRQDYSSFYTPLHWAASLSWQQGLDVLLSRGAKAEMTDKKGNLPLHLVTEAGIARSLIQKNSPLNTLNDKGETPAAKSMLMGNEAVFMEIVKAGAKVDWIGEGRKSLLHLAVEKSMENATDFLVQRLDVNAVDEDLRTPLFKARTVAVLNKILAQNPVVNLKDASGNSPFTIMVKRYLTNTTPEGLTIISKVIAAGADVNHKIAGERTVLFDVVNFTSINGDAYFGDLMSMLMQTDFNFNSLDPKKRTALFYVDTVQEVKDLKAGSQAGPVNPTLIDKDGNSAEDIFKLKAHRARNEVQRLNAEIAVLEQRIEDAKNSGDTWLVGQLEQEKAASTRRRDDQQVLAKLNAEIAAEIRI